MLVSSKFVWHTSEDKNQEEISYLSIRESFTKEFLQIGNNGLDGLLNLGALQLSYISGSLLVVPADENLEEIYEMRSPAQIPTDVRDDLLQKMQIISHSKTYPPSRQAAIKDAIELVKKLINSDEKKQRFKQKSHAIAITPAVKSSAIILPALLKNPKAKADGIFWKFIFALCTL